MVALGLTTAAPPGQAVAQTVKDFLLNWDNGRYADAAALTTGGRPDRVAAALQAAYSQLGAADIQLGMGPIVTHGSTAKAWFDASVDLGRGGSPWRYQGAFGLRKTSAGWRVVWSPSVIAPGLRPGDRLAVLTQMPERAPLLDSAGGSLIPPSPDYQIGVYPGQVRNPLATAAALARLAGIPGEALEMKTQILAAPSRSFLELIRLTPAAYGQVADRIGRIAGVRVRQVTEHVFASTAAAVTGEVGTETTPELISAGAPYQPGITVGISGLQGAFQSTLAGTPTVQVVVESADGGQPRVLRTWPGRAGQPVRTTISAGVQKAAQDAVGGSAGPAAIVAIKPGTGQILAVAQRDVPGLPPVDPLDGRYSPGLSFTMVSAAALLTANLNLSAVQPCPATNYFGGFSFGNLPPPSPGLGPRPTIRTDFTHGCATGLAGLILNPAVRNGLSTAARGFGIGQPWKLPLPANSGSLGAGTGSQADLTAAAIGVGDVRVSPLTMALAAGVAQSGAWHGPSLIPGPAATVAAQRPFRPEVISALQGLMRAVVTSGAGHAAVGGGPIAGQVGVGSAMAHGLYPVWFVGYSHGVAFAVLVFSHSASFGPAAAVAGQFAAGLPG